MVRGMVPPLGGSGARGGGVPDAGQESGLATTVGGNLFVGVAPYKTKKSGLRWFAEVRAFIRSGRNPLSLNIGLNAPLGG